MAQGRRGGRPRLCGPSCHLKPSASRALLGRSLTCSPASLWLARAAGLLCWAPGGYSPGALETARAQLRSPPAVARESASSLLPSPEPFLSAWALKLPVSNYGTGTGQCQLLSGLYVELTFKWCP